MFYIDYQLMNHDAISHFEKVNDLILLPLLSVASEMLADFNKERSGISWTLRQDFVEGSSFSLEIVHKNGLENDLHKHLRNKLN